MKTHLRHLQITKFVPQILNRVNTHKRGTEHTNPLDTADASNADTRAEKPEPPLRREAVVALVVELAPAEDRRKREEQQHAIEQDEPADSCVAVLEQHHSRDEPDGRALEVQLFRGEVGERDAEGAECGVKQAHEGVVELFRVGLAGLEFEGAVVVGQVAREADEHLAEWRVDVEVEFALEVVGTELAEAVVRIVRSQVLWEGLWY